MSKPLTPRVATPGVVGWTLTFDPLALTQLARAYHVSASASAQGGDFRGGDFHGGDNGFMGGYGSGDGYGYGNGGGYGNRGGYGNGGDKGYGDWYGISSGHKECPLFRKGVMTPDGWRVQMVPIC